MRLVVYTAAVGETDAVRAPEVVVPGVRYVCFSDQRPPEPYAWVEVQTADDGTPRSREIKILGGYEALALDADATLWHDASYRLTGGLDWLERALVDADVVGMSNPKRASVHDEGQAAARYGYVTAIRAAELAGEYRRAGFAGTGGLTSGGLIGRRTSQVGRAFSALWWAEVRRWGYRDQPSLDYAAWAAGAVVARVPGTPRANPYAAWRAS